MRIETLYIDRQVADFPETIALRERLSNIPATTVDRVESVFQAVNTGESDPISKGKRILFLTRNKGAFIKSCPGTQHYTCCGYKILHIGTYCTMDCSYCILQSYFHPPVLQWFVNKSDLYSELLRLFEFPGIHRVGTGEFTDSLIWESITGGSAMALVTQFAKQSRAVLELKTKTVNIDGLKNIDHRRKTIMAWSLNTEQVIASDERYTASLHARLRAAKKCEAWGYPLAFHFDPMVIYDGCEAAYYQVVKQLFSHVSPENVVWISLGAFRFMPPLKALIQQRFKSSKIVYGEFITGLDNKMRYFKPMRIRLFRKMVSWIKTLAPNATVYFCMEDDEVWQKSFGYVPADRGGLSKMLDDSAVVHCGLKP